MKKQHKHISFLIFIGCLSYLTFNELGIIKFISLYKKQQLIQNEIAQLNAQEQYLIEEIKNLENNPEYIEKIARELFYMAKKDEKIYRVEQEKTIK